MRQNNNQGRLQKPIGFGLNASSFAADVIKGIDHKGKIAIVTGGSTGIGLETTKVLALAGAIVIVAERDMKKAGKNLEGTPNIELEPIDIMGPRSIDPFEAK